MWGVVGMGTLHAWESFGDSTPPDIQAVAKGLGGGSVVFPVFLPTQINSTCQVRHYWRCFDVEEGRRWHSGQRRVLETRPYLSGRFLPRLPPPTLSCGL